MEIDNDVSRTEIERLVKELMSGEQGKAIKKKAMEWKLKAEEATNSSIGSSYMNLNKMINMVLRSPINQIN
ncbi:hypothetical protein RCOM_0186980 [Ricinus communis]|uniref:Uncharacterized protein n=1 Tax=Ricinus communis TaxID=3988 RepID=B9T1J8_RICCO|nr:hypothetical protein RCOM_0186980 [Ricinus communis]